MADDSNDQCRVYRKRVEELEVLTKELLREQQEEARLDFAWSGNLGHWYWNVQTNAVVFHPLKVTTLGYDIEELPEQVPYQFFTEKLHPDDYEKAMDAMRAHLAGKTPVYEIEYRIRAKDGSWKWFHDRGKVTQWTEEGRPLFLAGIVFDVTESKERESELAKENIELRREAGTDALTQVSNRRAALNTLQNLMQMSVTTKRPLSVAMFDIDHFKQVNDTRGHTYGDYVLRTIADHLHLAVRGMDTVGRYGGEEFILLFYGADSEAAAAAAERIREQIEEMEFDGGVKVTISGGVEEYEHQEMEQLIDGADRKLYRAKKLGRNRIVV